MNTTSLSIKIEPKIKAQIQTLADEFNVSVADLVNAYLKQLVKNKSVLSKFSENPTPYLLESIKIARKERKIGKTSPVFDNADDSIKWLNS